MRRVRGTVDPDIRRMLLRGYRNERRFDLRVFIRSITGSLRGYRTWMAK